MVELLLQAIKTFIHSASYNIEADVGLDFLDKLGCTPLYHACCGGYQEIVKLLIEFKKENRSHVSFNVNAAVEVSRRTPLHAAVRQRSLEIIKLLLTAENIDINVKGCPAEGTQSELIQNYQRNALSGATLNYQKTDSIQEDDMQSSAAMYRSSTGLPIKKPQKAVVHDSKQEDTANRKRSETNVNSVKLGESNLCIYEDPDTGRFDIQMKNALGSVGKNFDELFITPLAEACACFQDAKIMELLLLQGARDDNGLACRIAHLIERSDLIKLILSYCAVLQDQHVSEGREMSAELNWSHLKLQYFEGNWLGAEAEFYPLRKNLSRKHGGISDFSKTLVTSPDVKVLIDAVHTVHLDCNQLQSIPIDLFQLKNVCKINVSSNKIARLPLLPPVFSVVSSDKEKSSGWMCPFLTELDLSYNVLTHIPACVWSLPSLAEFCCSNNKVEALLPKDGRISVLSTSLKNVDLSSNSLKGVSDFLFELKGLRILRLDNNMITELPGKLYGLVKVCVS